MASRIAAVDDLDPDAEIVAVVGERRRVRRRRRGRRAAVGIRTPASSVLSRGQIVTPEPDVVQVRVLVADPHRSGHLLDQLQVRGVDRVADRGGQDEVRAGAVAVVDCVEMEDRPPGDAELLGQLYPRRGDVRDDDADVVVRRTAVGAFMGAGSRRRRRGRGR